MCTYLRVCADGLVSQFSLAVFEVCVINDRDWRDGNNSMDLAAFNCHCFREETCKYMGSDI